MTHIQCKGKNGFFIYKSAESYSYQDFANISIYSRRKGREAPIVIQGGKKAIIELLEEILLNIRKS